VDFERDGKQSGFISVPHSSHDSAYGRVQIPVIAIRNGDGPTALLVAGNHGDEYEGQIALTKLGQALEPQQITGRIIILPALNVAATQAALRCSPLDGGNLNRLFPGDADGEPTAMIAHYVESVLLPMATLAIDLHSGGSSLVYAPCAIIRDKGPREFVDRQFAALKAFGGSLAYVTDGRNQGADRTFAAAADRCGVIAVTTELGGGASVDKAGLDLAEAGVRRVLHHFGILAAGPARCAQALRLMQVESGQSYVLAPEDGVFEPLAELRDEVEAGDLAGRLLLPQSPWQAPVDVRFEVSGFVICRRPLAWTKRGDCLFQVLAPYRDAGRGL
jgi:predicted deacylase